jgi:adhesin YadB/C
MNMGSFKIEGLANGVESNEAINKGQLDALELHVEGQISTLETTLNGQISQLDSDLSLEETARIAADSALSSRLDSLESDEVSKSYVDAADLVLDGKISTEKGRIDAILLSAGANTDTFAEIVSLINSVDTENDTAFASYVLTNNAAVAQVASDLISKESSLISADEALDARLDILEADPTTKLYVDTQVSLEGFARLDGDTATLSSANSYADGIVATEESARIAGDASTLSSAESYTDAEVLIEKNRAEAAEGMLSMRVLFLEGKTLEEDLMFEVGVNSVGVNSITLPKMATGIYKVCVGRLNVFKNVDYTVGTEMVMSNGIPSPKTKLTWIGELASGGNSPISSGDKIFISYLYNA